MINILAKKYGRLQIITIIPGIKNNRKGWDKAKAECICDCGKKKKESDILPLGAWQNIFLWMYKIMFCKDRA